MSRFPRCELRVDRRGTSTRAAVVVDGRLTDLQIDNATRPTLVGAIFLGRVKRIITSTNSALIDLGVGAAGALPVAGPPPAGGASILVQVRADARGAKGPVLTADWTLVGRRLILAPLAKGVVVSKRVGDAATRAELIARVRAATTGSGWIVRSGATGATIDELAVEADALSAERREIEDAMSGPAPRRLRPPIPAPIRALTDLGAGDLAALRFAREDDAETVRRWCADHAPDLLGKIAVHAGPDPLFEEDDLEREIAGAIDKVVPLPGGGSLVIERTEAMWVVDVNGGERPNALSVNLDAARELARRLRVREMSGVIVVDFINPRAAGDRERLIGALTGFTADDPARVQVYGLSKLGLAEMTRDRRGPALDDVIADGEAQ